MKKFGLVGYPLEHSFSADYFNRKFADEGIDAKYINFEVRSAEEIYDLICSDEEIVGLNVTSPYKEDVMSIVSDTDYIADMVGAVNVLKIFREDGAVYIKGYNTDSPAFGKSIIPLMHAYHVSALILGTGGAAHAVAYALTQLGVECVFVSRSECAEGIFYREITEKVMRKFRIIVNCTPVGMFPEVNAMPKIPYKYLTPEHLLYDLIYNPEETRFLAMGRRYGAQTKNGLEMLHLQAEASWEIWNREETFTFCDSDDIDLPPFDGDEKYDEYFF